MNNKSLKEQILPIAREILEDYPELALAVYKEGYHPVYFKYSSVYELQQALTSDYRVVGGLTYHARLASVNNGSIVLGGRKYLNTVVYHSYGKLMYVEPLDTWTFVEESYIKYGSSVSGSSTMDLSELKGILIPIIKSNLDKEANVKIKTFAPNDPHTTMEVFLSGQHEFCFKVDTSDYGCKIIIRNQTTDRVIELVVTDSIASMGIIHVNSEGSPSPTFPSVFFVNGSKFTR